MLLISVLNSIKEQENGDNNLKSVVKVLLELVIECLGSIDLMLSDENNREKYANVFESNLGRYNALFNKEIFDLICTEIINDSELSSHCRYLCTTESKVLAKKYFKGTFNSVLDKYNSEIDIASILKGYKIEKKEWKDVVEPDEDENDELIEMWEDTVYQEVQKIIEVYSHLFESGMQVDKPVGILVENGYKTYIDGKGVGLKRNPILQSLYTVLENTIGKDKLKVPKNTNTIDINDINHNYNYYCNIQARNLFGVCQSASGKVANDIRFNTWSSFKQSVVPMLNNIMYTVIKNCNTDDVVKIQSVLAKVRNALTTCILISDYDKATSIKLKIYTGNALSRELIDHAITQGKLFSGKARVKLFTQSDNVYNIVIVFDDELNSRKPLFAYKAIGALVNDNKPISWRNVILGRDIDTDKIFTVDFSNNAMFNCIIGAGQRSGKGVMTLNILASAFAEGFPIFYADGKPEMGKMLWQLGAKYNIPVLAVDCAESHPRYDNIVANGLPSNVKSKSTVGLVIAYVKMLQLAVLYANCRNMGMDLSVEGYDCSKDRVVFVFDESIAFKAAFNNAKKALENARDMIDSKDKESKNVIIAYLNWLKILNADFSASLMSQMPKNNMNLFWLNQSMTGGDWNVADENFVANAVRSANTVRLIGSGLINHYFGVPATKKNENYINMTERCFGYYTGASRPADDSGMKVLKPYLILPSHDRNDPSDCINQIEKVVPNDILDTVRNSQGEYREDIGFEGIIKLIAKGDDTIIASTLRKSYDLAYKILDSAKLLDKYNVAYEDKVYHYMYDNDSSSLLATDDIIDRIKNGVRQESSGEESTLNLVIQEEDIHHDQVEAIVNKEVLEDDLRPEDIFGGNKQTSEKEVVHTEPIYEEVVCKDIPPVKEAQLNTTDKIDSYLEELRKELMKNMESNTNVIPPVNLIENRKVVYEGSDAEVLSKDNSIDCSNSVLEHISKLDNMFMRSKQGSIAYIDKLWLCILNEASDTERGVRLNLIAKIGLYGGNLYVNNRIVNLNGIINGKDAVELVNIVNFKILFNKFKGITELQLDNEMMEVLICDLNIKDDLSNVFRLAPRLRIIQYLSDNKLHKITRSELLDTDTKQALGRRKVAIEHSNNNYLSGRQRFVTSWKESTKDKKVWGASMSKRLFSSAKKEVKGKTGFAKGVGYGTASAFLFLTGLTAYSLFNGTRALKNTFKRY